ncbi:hypothetical protein WJX79_000928 [Trebouxia sp. C0005]
MRGGHLACICHLLLVALVLGLGALTGYTGLVTSFKITYCQDSVLEQLLVGKAIVDGPMKANSTSPEGARIYQQSKVLIQGYLEVCNQQRTHKAWAAFHIHRVTLKVVTPLTPLQAWGRKFVAQVQTLESGRLVLSLAIIATLAAFMFINVIKHKQYFYEQQPNSHGEASAEGVTGASPKRLTLLQLLEVTDTDDLDAMVVLLLVGVHLVWRMASGLAACLAMTCQACALIAAAVRPHLLSTLLQWTRSFLQACLVKAKRGWSASMSRIVSVFKACTGQTARAIKMTAALHLMTAERDGLAAKLQAAKYARTTTDDYLHELLRKSENRALEAEGQTRHYSQRVRTLEWQKFQDKQSDRGLAQKSDSLAALLSRTRQEKRQVEDRLHGVFTHVSSLEEEAARAKQSHAAELSDVITNLELSKKDLAHSEQARVAEANNSASLSTTLQSLKSFCDSQTHKLSESCASLHLSDHLRNSLEQRLQGVTAQCDRLANQVESLRNGKFDQDREVRAAEFKCVNLRQQLAEALSGKTELTLYATQLTAEKLNAESAVLSAGKQDSERQLVLLGGQNVELQHQLTAAAKEAAQHATRIGCGIVANECLQVQLTAESQQKQQLADKVAGLEADQLQQQRDREARAHSKEVTRLRDLLEVAHPAKSHTLKAAAAMPVTQPNNPAANTPTPKLAPGGAGKAVPAFPSPSANSCVGRGKATPANPYILGEGALSAAQASPADPAAAGSSQAGAVVPNKQPSNMAANIPTPKPPPVGADKALPAFISPSAKGIVSSGQGALSAAQASPANPPAAGSSQAVLPALQKSPAQVKADPSKPGNPKHGADRQASAAAALVSFRQAAVHTEGVPKFDNAHGVLADQLWGDHPAKSHTPEAAAAMPVTQPNKLAANTPTPKLAPGGAGKAVPAFPSPSADSCVGRGKATPADPYILQRGALSAAQASAANPPAAGSSQAGAVVPNKQPNNMAANIPTPKPSPVGADKALPAFPSPSAKGIVSSGQGALSAAQASPANPPAVGSSQAVLPALQTSLAQDKAVPSKPGTPKHASEEAVLPAGLHEGSLVSSGLEATTIGTHQHGGSQTADNPSRIVSAQASCAPAFTVAHDVELLAGDSSILDLRDSKPGVLSHMTDQELEAILLADSP